MCKHFPERHSSSNRQVLLQQHFSLCQYLLDPEEQVIPYTMNEPLYSLSNVGATKVGGKKRAGSIVSMEDIYPSPQNY